MELSYEQYAELMDELVSEGHDVLDASEMIFSGQLNEIGVNFGGQAAVDRVRSGYAKQQQAQQQTSSRLDALRKQRFGGSSASISGAPPAPKLPSPAQADAMDRASGKPSRITSSPKPARPAVPASSPKPATASAPAKPAVPASAPTKPATTPMQQFAAANPKLAAASAERDRTRGTSATTNPLMKKTFGADYVSKMPAPKTPSPTTSSTAFSSSTPALGTSTPAMQSAGTAAASKPTTTGVSGFKMSTDLSKPAETKKNQQKIAAGMEIRGDRLQEQLRVDNYGGSARPDSLLDAYQAIYNQ